MVRFIIIPLPNWYGLFTLIYIPIWLDLLFNILHRILFVFPIYIPIWLDLLSINTKTNGRMYYIFTFQYG